MCLMSINPVVNAKSFQCHTHNILRNSGSSYMGRAKDDRNRLTRAKTPNVIVNVGALRRACTLMRLSQYRAAIGHSFGHSAFAQSPVSAEPHSVLSGRATLISERAFVHCKRSSLLSDTLTSTRAEMLLRV